MSAAVRHPSGVALVRTVRREDLRVVFQPIVLLSDGTPFAYEALVRCSHPELAPPALLHQAHASGCVGRLGRMIREIAVPLGSGERLFLNVHAAELDSAWLVRLDDPLFCTITTSTWRSPRTCPWGRRRIAAP